MMGVVNGFPSSWQPWHSCTSVGYLPARLIVVRGFGNHTRLEDF
jgi:hypothetical protein